MPRYELSVILRIAQRPETVATMKSLVSHVLQKGNIVRGIQCLGSRGLPMLKKKDGERLTEGTYFLVDMDCPENQVQEIRKHFQMDRNVISAHSIKHDIAYAEPPPCGGMEEPDYGKLLDSLKRSGKHARKPETHPYVP